MLITKFNKMIRNRVLWGAFAVVICIMFVGTFSPTKSGGCDMLDKKNAGGGTGLLYGAAVTPGELNQARFFELGMRKNANLTPEKEEHLRIRSWKRIAAIRTAEKMGIEAPDIQVAEVIQRDPNFSDNNVFNKNKYISFVENQLGMTVGMFEEYIRQELILRKLLSVLESTVWTSPVELSEKLGSLTDTFVLECATLTVSNLVGKIVVSDEDTETFFEENKKFFEIPERVSVKYVNFPISNYLADAAVSDDDVKDYYDSHIENYTASSTNDTSLSASATNDLADKVPLEQVKDDIVAALKYNIATFKARDAASEFVVTLTPAERNEKGPDFDATAAASNLTVHTSAFFSIRGRVPGLNVDSSFNKTAFDLDPLDPSRYFSDAIIGSNSVYVIAANQRTESRIPAFEEVIDEIRPHARRNAEWKAFAEKARETTDSIKKSLQAGRTFAEAATALKLNVTTTQPFTIYETGISATNEIEHYEELAPRIAGVKKGGMTDPIEIKGGVLLAYVADRTPGDLMSMEALKPQLQATLDRYRAGILFGDWCDYALAKGGITNLAFDTSGADKSEETPEPDIPPDVEF